MHEASALHIMAFSPFAFLLSLGKSIDGCTDLTPWLGFPQKEVLAPSTAEWKLQPVAALDVGLLAIFAKG